MSGTTILFNSLGDAINTFDDQPVVGGGPVGFSFSSGSSAGTLSSITLGLFDTTPTDGGTLTVQLFSSTSANSPGTLLETLGTIADSRLGTTDTSTYTLSNFGAYPLAANTRYWIEITGSSGNAQLAYSTGDGGTGVSTEYYYDNGKTGTNAAGGADIAQVVVKAAATTPVPGQSIVFNSLGDAVNTFDDQPLVGAGPVGFSFSTSGSTSTLNSLTLGLFDITPADGGTLTVKLLSSTSANVPGTVLATLGTIADSRLSTVDTSTYTLSNFGAYPLAANTRYWIEITGSSGNAQLAYSTGDGGTGVSTEYYYDNGAAGTNAADGADIAEVVVTPTCFREGTRILAHRGGTASGDLASRTYERPVETICPGDVVETAEGPQAVIWRGYRSVDVLALANPDDHWLVRIRRDAFGEAMPHRDLWVTQEHGILVDGGLVPARMLVNGGSIALDRTQPRYTYYHLELAKHAILFAEGLPSESYLDTGNRSSFSNAAVSSLRPDITLDPGHARWSTDAVAPLTVTRDQVEPIWRRLAERATLLGFPIDDASERTDDPGLALLLDNGARLAPCGTLGRRVSFRIPAGTRALRLLSRSARPSTSIGPFVDDRRRLGVAVETFVFWQGLEHSVIQAGSIGAAGWHDVEGRVRWTTGSATLVLPVACDATTLDVHLAGTLSYPLDPANHNSVAA